MVVALNELERVKICYEVSQVASAKEQIEILSKKETLCVLELEKRLLEEEKNIIEDKDKGKGKEK